MLLAPTGEAFYSPVATVSTLDPVRGIQEVSFPGCPNPLPPTEGTRGRGRLVAVMGGLASE